MLDAFKCRDIAARFGCALLLATPIAHAGDGSADGGFGTNGRAIHSWPSSTIQSETNAVATSANGSVVVAGWISYPSPQHDAISLVRFRADGTHDAAFGTGGVALFDLDPLSQIGERALGVFPLADGRTLVATVRTVDNSHEPLLLAVRANGSADTTFGPNGVREIDIARWAGARLQFCAAQRDDEGRVLLAGAVVDGGDIDALVVRVLPSGEVDAAFGDDGWVRIHSDERLLAASLVLDERGNIVVAGKAIGDVADRPMVARLHADGTPDLGFGESGLVRASTGFAGNWTAEAVVTAVRPTLTPFPQHRVFIAISRASPRSTGVLALADNGSIAASFADAGFLDLSREEGAHVTTLAMRRDLRLVVAGSVDPNGAGVGDFLVARADFDGVLDPTFDGNGLARYPMNADGDTIDTPTAMTLSGERPVIAGKLYGSSTGSYHTGVLRLQSDALFADGFD